MDGFLQIYLIGTVVVIVSGSIGSIFILHGRWEGVRFSLAMGSIAFIVFFLLLGQILKELGNKNYLDFAAWLEILKTTGGTGVPTCSIEGNLVPGMSHWFAAHFTPWIYLFAVPFRLASCAETLVVSQWVVMMLAPLSVYCYARHWLGTRERGLIMAAVFCLYPTLQYIMLYEFEMLRFAIPLLLFAFLALEKGRMRAYWLLFMVSLLVREEVSITTFLLGIYAVVFMKERRLVGLITSGVSLAYFLIVVKIVMPSFSTAGHGTFVAASSFASLGQTPLEVLKNAVLKPGVVFGLIMEPVKLANVFMYFLPLLFLSWVGWPVLLIAAGNIGANLLSNSGTHTSYFLYYLSPSIPFIFISAIKGIRTAGGWVERRFVQDGTEGRGIQAVLGGVFAAALVANVFFGPSPLSLTFWIKDYKLAPFRTQNFHWTQYRVTKRDLLLREVAKSVPKDAVVSAEQHILPLLYDCRGLMACPELRWANYAVFDKRRYEKTGTGTVPGSWDGFRQNPQSYYD